MPRNPIIERIGTITKDGFVLTEDGKKYSLPMRGMDSEGYLEVLIDTTQLGGRGWMFRQSIKPYIGMRCKFMGNNTHGYNFEVIKEI